MEKKTCGGGGVDVTSTSHIFSIRIEGEIEAVKCSCWLPVQQFASSLIFKLWRTSLV